MVRENRVLCSPREFDSALPVVQVQAWPSPAAEVTGKDEPKIRYLAVVAPLDFPLSRVNQWRNRPSTLRI